MSASSLGPGGLPDGISPASLADLLRETDLSTLVSFYEQVQPGPMSPVPSPDADFSEILMLADTFQEQPNFAPGSPLELPASATAPHPAAATLQQQRAQLQQFQALASPGFSLPSTPPLLFDDPSPGLMQQQQPQSSTAQAPNAASIAAAAQLLAQSGILPSAWGAPAAPLIPQQAAAPAAPQQREPKPFFTDNLPPTPAAIPGSLPFALPQQRTGASSSSSSSSPSPSSPSLSGPPSAASSPQLMAAAIAAAAASNGPNTLAAILANPQAASILANSLLAGALASFPGPPRSFLAPHTPRRQLAGAAPAAVQMPARAAAAAGLPALGVPAPVQQLSPLSAPSAGPRASQAAASTRGGSTPRGGDAPPAATSPAVAGSAGPGPTTRARASGAPAAAVSPLAQAVPAPAAAPPPPERRASAAAASRRRPAKEESSEEDDDDGFSERRGGGGGRGSSHNHAQVERKRRDLINERISQLKSLVPDLVHQTPNKATVLGRAVDHMQDLIEMNKQLQDEKESLAEELERLRTMSLASEAGSPAAPTSSSSDAASPPQAQQPGPGIELAPGLFIPAKDDALLSMFRADGAAAPAGVWPLDKVTLAQNSKQLASFIAPDLAVPHMSLKQFIAAALKLAMENLIVTDPNRLGHPIVYASQGFQHMTGYNKEEILGRNCRFLQGRGTDSQAIVNIGQAIREGREYLTEVLNYRKDGTPFWNLVYITPVEDQTGRTTNYIGVQFDITASKPSNLVSMVSGALETSPRVEMLGPAGAPKALPEDATTTSQPAKKQRDMGERQHMTTESAPNQGLKNLLASILHLSMSNLIVSDPRLPDNPIVYASEGFQKLTGYSKEEIVGRNCRFLQGPGTDENTVRAIREGLRQKAPFLAEILNYRKDGTPFWNLLFITPVLDPQGQPFKHIGVQLDVTDHHS
eukprot:tig00001042_g6598.t1